MIREGRSIRIVQDKYVCICSLQPDLWSMEKFFFIFCVDLQHRLFWLGISGQGPSSCPLSDTSNATTNDCLWFREWWVNFTDFRLHYIPTSSNTLSRGCKDLPTRWISHKRRLLQSDSKHWNVAIDGAFLPDYPENLGNLRPKYPALIGDMLEDYAFFSEFSLVSFFFNYYDYWKKSVFCCFSPRCTERWPVQYWSTHGTGSIAVEVA